MKRRYYTSRDYYAALGNGDNDWAVYDRQSKDPDERPQAIFAKRADALSWAASKNRVGR